MSYTENSSEKQPEVVIIGAGPIGIEMAVALKTAGIYYRHFEAGNIGSTMNWWAPDTVFFSSSDRIAIAGVPLPDIRQMKASREEYLAYLRAVAQLFALEIESYRRVVDVTRTGDGWLVRTAKSLGGVGGPQEARRGNVEAVPIEEVKSSRVVFAIGDMHLPQKLNVPGEDLGHVSHYFSDPHDFYNRQVLVVGGGNSAVEAAVRLVRVGAKVALCHRREKLDETRIKPWLMPEIASMIRRRLVEFLPGHHVKAIHDDVVMLARSGAADQAAISRSAQHVLLLTGYCQDSSLFVSAGIELRGKGRQPVYDPSTMETNQRGLYVAGTAAAGTQLDGVKEFIETSHVHVARILAHLQGRKPPEELPLPEPAQREL